MKIMMLSLIRMNVLASVLVAATLAGILSGCEKTSAERPRTLVGTYHLIHPTGCRNDIQESVLNIRGDGTYDQNVRFNDGRNESIENRPWRYEVAARRIWLSESLVSTETSLEAVTSHPAVIVVNRSTNCWYQHPK
jgi:hypothetical protein